MAQGLHDRTYLIVAKNGFQLFYGCMAVKPDIISQGEEVDEITVDDQKNPVLVRHLASQAADDPGQDFSLEKELPLIIRAKVQVGNGKDVVKFRIMRTVHGYFIA